MVITASIKLPKVIPEPTDKVFVRALILVLFLVVTSTRAWAEMKIDFKDAQSALKNLQDRMDDYPKGIKYKVPEKFDSIADRVAASQEAGEELERVYKKRSSFNDDYYRVRNYIGPIFSDIERVAKLHKEIHEETISVEALEKYSQRKFGVSYNNLYELDANFDDVKHEFVKRNAVIAKEQEELYDKVLSKAQWKNGHRIQLDPELNTEVMYNHLKELLPAGNCAFSNIELVPHETEKDKKMIKITFMHDGLEKVFYLGKESKIRWSTYPQNGKPEEFQIQGGYNYISNFFHLDLYPDGSLKEIKMKLPVTWESMGTMDSFMAGIGNPMDWALETKTNKGFARYSCEVEPRAKESSKGINNSMRKFLGKDVEISPYKGGSGIKVKIKYK